MGSNPTRSILINPVEYAINLSSFCVVVGQIQQQCQCRILPFVDTFVDKTCKTCNFLSTISPFCRQPKNGVDKIGCSTDKSHCPISSPVSLQVYQTGRWLHNSYGLGVLDNGIGENNTDASSIDKNEHAVISTSISHIDSKKVPPSVILNRLLRILVQ